MHIILISIKLCQANSVVKRFVFFIESPSFYLWFPPVIPSRTDDFSLPLFSPCVRLAVLKKGCLFLWACYFLRVSVCIISGGLLAVLSVIRTLSRTVKANPCPPRERLTPRLSLFDAGPTSLALYQHLTSVSSRPAPKTQSMDCWALHYQEWRFLQGMQRALQLL